MIPQIDPYWRNLIVQLQNQLRTIASWIWNGVAYLTKNNTFTKVNTFEWLIVTPPNDNWLVSSTYTVDFSTSMIQNIEINTNTTLTLDGLRPWVYVLQVLQSWGWTLTFTNWSNCVPAATWYAIIWYTFINWFTPPSWENVFVVLYNKNTVEILYSWPVL